jgi:hypothetical protein
MIEIKILEPDFKSFFRAGFRPIARKLGSGEIRPSKRPTKKPVKHLIVINQCVVAADPFIEVVGEAAVHEFFYFFADVISNQNTRRAYAQSIGDFITWCERVGVYSILDVQDKHVATFIDQILSRSAMRTARQRLAALRCLFSYMVGKGVLFVNPAELVRIPVEMQERLPITIADVELIAI